MTGYANAKSVTMVVGLSFRTAPVELREKLAVPEAEWPRAIAELCGHNHLEEAAVLSTCNRMEIYVVALSWHRGLVEVLEWMSKVLPHSYSLAPDEHCFEQSYGGGKALGDTFEDDCL